MRWHRRKQLAVARRAFVLAHQALLHRFPAWQLAAVGALTVFLTAVELGSHWSSLLPGAAMMLVGVAIFALQLRDA